MKYGREITEFLLLFGVALIAKIIFEHQWLDIQLLEVLIVLWAFSKTFYFIFENSVQLLNATAQDIPYHRFLVMMTYNIGQMTLSYAIDFFCLNEINSNSFSGINPNFLNFERMFEFFYFSVLNFTFFGYGDLTPATIPTKTIMLMEVVVAFLTMIFILSDFISMKESLRKNK